MKKMNSILVLAAIALSCQFLSAQETALGWLKKMNNTYATATSIQLEFEAFYYNSHTRVNPVNTMKGKVKSSGDDYYSDAMGQEIIVNKKSMLIIDKTEKTITCLPGSGKKKKQSGMTTTEPDSAWLAATSITLLNTAGGTRTVVIKEQNSMYEKTEIVINAVTCALERVTYYYNTIESGTKPCFVVQYRNVVFNAAIPDSTFSEKKYIQRKGGTISPAAAWADYTIIDLTDRYEN
jgi:outer membrane lipoprotein-sorting protein